MASEERDGSPEPSLPAYRTKRINFFGRSTPIILQNNNGPCPLIAICNVLLLRNSLDLGVWRVPLSRLLTLIAEKLIDSSSQFKDRYKDIGDAIDLLPRLATGINVDVQFRRINDFEFMPECKIFDLLGIDLYHGWLVDPQDIGTAAAIGSKSYNTLVGELAFFDAKRLKEEDRGTMVEDAVDFAAAKTAVLGIPSPCLPRKGRGDKEENEELMRALTLSKVEISSPVNMESSGSENHADPFVAQDEDESEKLEQPDFIAPQRCNEVHLQSLPSTETDPLSTNTSTVNKTNKSVSEGIGEFITSGDLMKGIKVDVLMPKPAPYLHYTNKDGSIGSYTCEGLTSHSENQSVQRTCTEDFVTSETVQNQADNLTDCDSTFSSDQESQCTDSDSTASSCLDDSKPMYEGEEVIHDSALLKFDVSKPVCEGEVFLAEQFDGMEDIASFNSRKAQKEYYLIKNFLETTASQLTIYGLFCLQEGLEEKGLCVFFRNNHFSTLLKFEGELYLLATDEGFIDHPDLVWEKLNEVNGNTVFMTGNFAEFKIDNRAHDPWNKLSSMTDTADYLAKVEGPELTSFSELPLLDDCISSFSCGSDHEMAMNLQSEEYEHQRQDMWQQTSQQQSPNSGGSSPGSQVLKSSTATQKNDSKLKEHCNVCDENQQ